MPIGPIQLLLVGIFILIWHRCYKRLQQRSTNTQVGRRSEIQAVLDRMRQNHAESSDLPSVPAVASELAVQPPPPEPRPVPRATGIKGVVATRRRLIRCTEYDLAGELQTEICRVDPNGRVIGKPRVIPGAFRSVARDVVNRRIA